MAIQIKIHPAEAGQKVLRYLERSLDLPRPLLFRWLRTGQVRVNKCRVKHEQCLEAGDELRLPPQAEAHLRMPLRAPVQGDESLQISQDVLGGDLRIIFQDDQLLVLDKPCGLPVQPGGKHNDSVSQRLAAAAEGAAYKPSPAHRLDKACSGVLLAAKTHACGSCLHGLFADKTRLERDYLAWVSGIWNLPANTLFTDNLGQSAGSDGLERVAVFREPEHKTHTAQAIFETLKTIDESPVGPATLLRVRLLTGRKHQIRVQCSSRSHPIIGDPKYLGPKFRRMLLHAVSVSIPEGVSIASGRFSSMPDWPAPFDVSEEDIGLR